MEFKSISKSKKNPEINLTPMIDIIFNLLIFFLITAVISQKGLSLKLPESSTAEKRPPKSIEISVTKDKKIIFNGKSITKNEVRTLLTKQKNESGINDNIILKADKDAPFGLFVFVMDTARKIGLKNLVIATEVKKETEQKDNE